ncbi:MAG: DNA polymerase III subunit beta [Thermodesulfobacteriota bacterium]|nr:MAG: DNA polymerase III subunit beta [Thermodesulfobacteriota bacterium]
MKFAIKRKVLLEGLEIVKDSVGKQTSLPILKNVKLKAQGEALELFTTNLSIGTMVLLKDLTIAEEGEALCDALKLMAIVKELPENDLRIEIEEKGHLRVKCEKSHFKLLTMPPEEFPCLPEVPEKEFFPLGERFFQYLSKVRYAASKDDLRHSLNGVFMGADVVATDGQRMAVLRRNLGFNDVLVPLEFISLILKLKNRENGNTFQAGCSNNIIIIRSEGLSLFSRLIDAEFPDYSKAIPDNHSRYALMQRKDLMQALKRIMLMSGKDYSVRFEFNPSSLFLSSFNPNLGDASEEMEIEYQSERDKTSFIIGLNGKFLLDMLEVLDEERVKLQMISDESPLMIEEHDCLHVLMPIQLLNIESEAQSETNFELDSDPEPEPEFVEEEEAA